MNKVDLKRWQMIEDEFLNSDLDEVAFCKSRKLNIDWFRNKLREAEQQGSKPEKNSENMFVELIPEIKPSIPTFLKYKVQKMHF